METCGICGGPDSKPYYGDDRRLLQCQKCGVVFLAPELIKFSPKDYYENARHYAEISENDYKVEQLRKIAKNYLKFLLRHVRPAGKLLDIGAHTGMFVEEAGKSGFKATGLEPNKFAASQMQKRDIPVICSSIEDFKCQESFNVITAFEIIEHLSNPMAMLEKMENLLSFNGYLALSVPNLDSYFAKRYALDWPGIDLEHLYYFSEKSLSEILKKLGFRIVAVKKFNYIDKSWGVKKICRYILGRERRNSFLSKSTTGSRLDAPKAGKIKDMTKNLLVGFAGLFGLDDSVLIVARKIV